MSSFDRLTPALQYQIAHTLGFRELRPVQEATIEAVLDGDNCVVLAPTAGGKTEAAFFPLLSGMDADDWRPVSVIYLSPIRALLNSQQERIGRYAETIGRRVFKWHGDVTASARKAFLASPADFILTTPESLEAMMMSARVPAMELFASLRAVIIDEVHAFAADDRGAHLSAVLERLSRFCGRDVQRIGLSATVGNPEEILRWVQGSSKRPGRVIDPKGERNEPALVVDYVGEVENAAIVVKALHPGKKRLVFVDSRSGAERLGRLLNERGVTTFVTHGSLSVTERRDAERAFLEGSDCVIVATSALELGIDVGDLDHVLQIDCPRTVASLLQRMGRTGRRPGMTPNCTMLTTKDEATLQAAATIELLRAGYVEPVRPSRRASHILAHQVMALAVQLGGAARGDIGAWVHGASAFADLDDDDRRAVISHMLEQQILADTEGRLWLGEVGEKRYGRANFRQLYAVFESPKLVSVRWDTREIGMVDADFLAAIDSDERRGAFVLAGRPWEIVTVEWERGICVVKPGPDGRAPRWSGAPRHLGYELCQAMRRVLVSNAADPSWSKRATAVLTTMRAEHSFLRDDPSPLISTADDITWWNYAGGGANALLGRMLEAELGGHAICRNISIRLIDEAGKSVVAVRELLRRWARKGRPTEADARQHAAGAIRGRVSKFQPCLPDELLRDLLVRSVLDPEGARRVVAVAGG